MKPAAPIDDRKIAPRRRSAPLIERSFQSGPREPFGHAMFGWNREEPSGKRAPCWLTGEYFRREMQREFRFEAVAFTIIVATSAWALASLILMLVG